jgi:LuxR family maltose regulon positive regulatory protein
VTGPLITTKFHAPARRPTSVPRPRLTQRLATGARLILIAAPAGFGKTSILTEWLATLDGDTAVAWVSLDERDDPENQFWAYVITALDRAVPGVGTTALDLLAAANPTEAALATLINDLDASAREIVLVLDDLHTIENPAIHAGLAFLVDGLPENVRLVIATRADPPLPLARLRALGGLLELRAADLRFTADEAAEYLNGSMGLGVGDDDVRALGERTEGWIAAIQLAALSLRGRDDAAAFIAGFAGDDRYVVDYLVEEVLQQQDDAVRTFLLETSILSRLTGDLCDAVTGTTGGGGILESLDRANLFLVPLDDRREWYRYHHLFGEMLRARLLDERPERVADLHGRASEWLEQNGSPTEAIDHALDAGAFGRAAELILAAMRTMQQHRQEATLVQWFERLPPEAVRTTPGLSIGFAGVLLSSGRTDGVEALLKDAEDAVGGSTDGILDLRRGIALYRAAQALTQGDLGTASQQSATAVDLADDGSDIDRGSANGLRGLVLWALGDLVAAEQSWAVSLDSLYRAGHRSDMIGGSIAMADILLAAAGCATPATSTLAGSRSPPRPNRCGVGRPTCTSGWRRCCASRATSRVLVVISPPPKGSANMPGCRRPGIGGGWRRRGWRAPKATRQPRSPCSTTRNGSTRPTSFPRCDPSPRCVPACTSLRAAWPTRVSGRGAVAWRPTTSCRTCASTTTSPSRACCWRPSRSTRRATCSRGCWTLPRRGSAAAASSSCWC